MTGLRSIPAGPWGFGLRVTLTFQKSWEELSARGGWRALPLEGVQLRPGFWGEKDLLHIVGPGTQSTHIAPNPFTA